MIESKRERVFQGTGVSPGAVLGQALKLDSHHRVILRVIVDDKKVDGEVERFQRALEASKAELESLRIRLEEKVGREHSFILDAHALMLEDEGLVSEIVAIVRNKHVCAEWAVREATDRIRVAYASLDDEYFRERASDVENVVERILLNLSGDKLFSWEALPGDLIVVSHDFNPSTFATMDLSRVRGMALESGGRTSHTAIIARGLGLPTVMGIRDFLFSISTGDILLLDGDEGRLVVNPTDERIESLRIRIEETLAAPQPASFQAGARNLTREGKAISLRANAEFPHEVQVAKRYGAEGIGLFRSEFVFFRHPGGCPSMQEQLDIYRALADEMNPYPVAIRTLDIVGGRLPDGTGSELQPNPSMGLRGIRLSLMTKQAFAGQIEAILRAGSVGKKVEIVFPMVSSVEEVWEAKAIVEGVQASLPGSSEVVGDALPIGVMIEVPAAVLSLEPLAQEVDFLCVGTNDLIQYMLAVDRANPQVSHLYQPLNPSVLECLRRIAEVSRRLNKPVRICGEMCSNPFYAVLLLGMGFTELSMNAAAIPMIRKIIRKVTTEECRKIAERTAAFLTAREAGKYLIDTLTRLVDIDLSAYSREIQTPGD